MAYDPDLADRVRAAVTTHAARRGLRTDERRMFGGLAFMVEGKMACGVIGEELMARVGPSRHAQALEHPHARPMDFTGRPMTGYVFIKPAGCSTPRTLQEWVAQAVDHVSTLTHGAILTSTRRWPRTSGTVLPQAGVAAGLGAGVAEAPADGLDGHPGVNW